jgi:hypothetical protein
MCVREEYDKRNVAQPTVHNNSNSPEANKVTVDHFRGSNEGLFLKKSNVSDEIHNMQSLISNLNPTSNGAGNKKEPKS